MELDNSDVPLKKRCLIHSPSLASSVRNWLSDVPCPDVIPRPNTAPPQYRLKISAPAFELPAFLLPAFQSEVDMSQSGLTRLVSVGSTINTRPSTSDPLYRETIYWNNITLDPTGMAIAEEAEIQELLDNHIFQQRKGSPPLSDEEVKEVVMKAADLLDNAEGKASDIIDTKAFPLNRPGIAEGRNAQWSTDALPANRKYPHPLSAPKPDRHYGYPLGRKFDWTAEEMAVINHRTAQPYTQPTRDNLFPFLALEIKSEATGGVLYAAENQAAGSGVHIVSSQRWMLKQAFPSKDPGAIDAVAFVGAVSQRTGVFYLVWYSDKKSRYIMSKIKIISFMEASDIQSCRDLINNITDYVLEKRLPFIRQLLAKLDPVPSHWEEISHS